MSPLRMIPARVLSQLVIYVAYQFSETAVLQKNVKTPATHPDSGLCDVGPGGDLLPGGHVGVPVPGEGPLQLLELL